MTVSSTTSRVSYSGNGSTTAFAVSFYFLENTHLKVILRAADGTETVMALTTHYTVSGAGNPAGGTVTMNTAPAAGTTLVIVRNVPLTQETDYQANDPFPAESHERALDKLTMEVQQQQLQLDRSIKVPATTPINVSTELPNPEMNKLIGWNESATGLQNIDGGTLATIVAYGTARSDVFTGDGVQTAFTLSYNPGSLNNLDVSIDGSTQVNGVDFTWAGGTTLTMTTAVPNGSKLLVRYMQGLPTTTADSDDVQYLPASGPATTVQTRLRKHDVKLNEHINVKEYGAVGDGVTDDTAAIQATINANPGKEILFTGVFRVTNTITLSTSNTTLRGVGQARIVPDAASFSTGQPVLRISGPGVVATTTLASSATYNNNSIQVASASGFASGKFITLTSSGEYWNGITGDSGFQLVNKSELNTIQYVSGTTITTEWNLADSYSVSGYTVTVKVYDFIENVKVIGLQFYGVGGGSAHTSASYGPEAIQANYVNNLEISGCTIQNFVSSAIRTTICNDVRICNNEILGRDDKDSSNLPNISDFAYGISAIGTCNFVVANNTGQNLRRLFDANYTSGTTIPRNGTVSGNTVVASTTGMGTHQAEYVNFIGNAIYSSGGIYIRGKSCNVIGNIIDQYDATTSAAGITYGGDDGTNYSNNPSCGYIVVADNSIRTKSAGILIRTDIQGGVISGNTIRGGTNHGIWVTPKRVQDFHIRDNTIDITNRTAARYCVYFNNLYDRCVQLQSVNITNNHLKNGSEGVRIEAPVANTNAATNIVIRGNFVNTDTTLSSAVRFSSGYFGKGMVFQENTVGSPTISGEVFVSGNRYLFSEWPDVGENNFYGSNQSAIGIATVSNLGAKQTALVGQRIINSAPAPGGYMGWVCTTSGTSGTISRTGSISASLTTLTIDDNTNNDAFVGCYLKIAGAGVAGADLVARVTAVSGTTVTLDTAASTSVTSAAVTYSAPVLKGYAPIQA